MVKPIIPLEEKVGHDLAEFMLAGRAAGIGPDGKDIVQRSAGDLWGAPGKNYGLATHALAGGGNKVPYQKPNTHYDG